MKRILFILTICLLALETQVQAQIDSIISSSGERGNLNSSLDFLEESGNITRYPRLTDAGEILYYAPLVSTDSVPSQSIFSSSAFVYGNILFNGWNESVLQQGFQYCTDTTQTDKILTLSVMPSSAYVDCENPCSHNLFLTNIIELAPSTTYYVRAFAKNNVGTGYGRWISFTTKDAEHGFRCGDAVVDVRGDETNEYGTIQIGQQCWMTENLRTSKKPDGTNIPTSGIFVYTHDGMGTLYFYNWGTAVNQNTGNTDIHTALQGICPDGWHMPCYDDINTLCTTVDPDFAPIASSYSGQKQFNSSNGLSIKLCYPAYWEKSSTPATPGYYQTDASGFNTTGLSILPTGYKDSKSTVCPSSSHIWTSVGDSPGRRCDVFKIAANSTGIIMQNASSSGASFFSVRCLQDSASEPTTPSVATLAASNVNSSTATISGTINSNGNTVLTEKGFYFSKNTDVFSGQKVTASSSTKDFSTVLSGLDPATTYYYRAFAVNEVGMSYGDILSFTTKQPSTLASVIIKETQNLMATNIDIACQVVNDGGETITERGVCWNTDGNPTTEDHKMQDMQGGTGEYTISANGLSPNTTYYFRAYAKNAVGTAYSNAITATTPDAHTPTLTTDSVTEIASKSALVYGSITSTGNSPITEYGFMIDTTAHFSKATVILSSTDIDHFSVKLAGLNASTTYYVKAFATNAIGTAYGQALSFTTEAAFECGSAINDNDNNTYHTILIGNQCWMKENLRTRTYADGSSIAQGNSASSTTAYWYYPDNNAANESAYGLLYNWKAAIYDATTSSINPSSIQGICPTGWHVPSGNDWNELIKYAQGHEAFECQGFHLNIAKALASTMGWQNDLQDCTPGNNIMDNNASGFSALPAGIYDFSGNRAISFGQIASFWGADNGSTGAETRFYLSHQSANPFLQSYAKEGAMSVRCLQDRMDSTRVLPTVVTTSVSAITSHTAVTGGNVLYDAESEITQKGVCYSTQPHPTLDNAHTVADAGQGTFVSQLSDLEQATTYYVRAYAINNAGIAYGNEVIFMTVNPNDGNACTEVATIKDNDGNEYATVQIGSQCWMQSNLRTTTYSDGSPIELGTANSQDKAYRYATSNLNTYGYLYNWKAVMREEESSNTIPSNIQGICPIGWHVPSRAEWTQLTDYVNSQSNYRHNQKERAIAKALASTSNWTSYSQAGSVGYSPSNNNATGFSIQPAGAFYGSVTATQKIATLWSSTAAEDGNIYYRYLQYFYGYMVEDLHDAANGFSVRCLKDDHDVILPTVTTAAVTGISDHSAISGGEVVFEDNTADLVRGVCWSTASTPTIYDAHTTDGHGTGSFVSNIDGLRLGTTYYVRAYATVGKLTTYGEAISFTTQHNEATQPCPGMETLTDRDGNEYHTVQIGEQCWMKENLRTTKYADGNSITQGTSTSSTTAYWYYPNHNADNSNTYGLLYNWAAAMNSARLSTCNNQVQGICPIGWHIPTESDWNKLMNYTKGENTFVCGNSNLNIAKALASTEGWQEDSHNCAPGNDADNNNVTGFGAMPAGIFSNTGNQMTDYGRTASFWRADNVDSETGSRFYLTYQSSAVLMESYPKASAMSVRCLRDSVAAEAAVPSVVTFDIDMVSSNSATVGGNVYDDGESAITMKGVCYSTQPHPTIDNAYTADDCGLGKYVSQLTDLESGTTYFVRAYAINSVGVAYGNELIFMTYNPNDGSSCASVSDYDGNSYTTVHIGGQCWMAEHLRSTTYSDGTPIAIGSSLSEDVAYRYTPNNSNTYGYLYNWKAVMRFDESSNAVPSGVQGICPAGWHVPSQAEWILFTDYISSQNMYRYNNKMRAIAKSIASTSNWSSYSEAGSVGNGQSSNNATGFNIKPAGAYYGSATADGKISALWSSTATENGDAYSRYLMYYYGYMGAENHNVINGFSVRCIKD